MVAVSVAVADSIVHARISGEALEIFGMTFGADKKRGKPLFLRLSVLLLLLWFYYQQQRLLNA
jgi:hypothetical protein